MSKGRRYNWRELSHPMACYHISKMLPTIDLRFNSQPHIFTKDSYILLCLSLLKNVPLLSSSNLWVIIYHWLSLNCRGETMEGCNFHLLPQFAGMFLRCLLSEL
jgi:hypothetical protein